MLTSLFNFCNLLFVLLSQVVQSLYRLPRFFRGFVRLSAARREFGRRDQTSTGEGKHQSLEAPRDVEGNQTDREDTKSNPLPFLQSRSLLFGRPIA